MAAAPQRATALLRNPDTLFYLPDELLVQVVSHLAGDGQTLCALARTCRFFQIEAEKHIYADIELLSTRDLEAIIQAFSRRPDRVAFVETLKILYRFHQGLGATADERAAFNDSIGRMKALRNWEIESPYDNFQWDEGGEAWVLNDMDRFRRHLEAASLKAATGALAHPGDVGLAKLERLVIHTHGATADFWTLGEFQCLFRHPSLRHLHVSCLALPLDLPELEPYAKSTPLIELIFDECELEPKSLGRILATPKNLKHLTLGENVYNVNHRRSTNPRLTGAPEAALAALNHVAHSLETLVHYDPMSLRESRTDKAMSLPGSGMREFHSLVSMLVDACSFLHRGIALSHTQAPPNLHTLQIRNPRPKGGRFDGRILHHETFFEQLPPYEPYTYLSSLKTLDFVQGAALETAVATPDFITQDDPLRYRHQIGYKLLKQHGINLKVTLEATWRLGLIPPYLHGEVQPEQVCVYNAAEYPFYDPIIIKQVADERAQSQPNVWLEGKPRPDNATQQPAIAQAAEPAAVLQPDTLTDSDVIGFRRAVARRIDKLWARMSAADPDEPHEFTVTIDSDDEMWDDDFDEDDEDLAEWMDAEDGDIEYVLAEELGELGPDVMAELGVGPDEEMFWEAHGDMVAGFEPGDGAEAFWEAQAQALLAAAEAAAAEPPEADDMD